MAQDISKYRLPVLRKFMRYFFCPHFLPVLIFALALLSPGQSFADQTEQNHLPSSIAGMKLKEIISGSRASQIIDQMHRGNVATKSNFIGRYLGKTASATYYVSLYHDCAQAEKAMEDMARVMEQEGHGFSHLMKRSENGRFFYMVLGQDQAHYFFARDIELVWLAVDVELAEKAIKDVLLDL